ncbi:DUF368 domain-containing protein [Halorientalis brevis]|uniref:DUF368 domain-containing protein n=1 Tax=Halorientalis brevis TaxID=1126241 RepID=A0ABD6CEG5_9EURY|nr:DUF368 domain-containing protein [Halorientalis brevis]
MCMGAADSVPGVSGGTIALITGIYERLITAITSLNPRTLEHVPRLHTSAGRQALWDDLVEMDLGFLVALGLGVVTALIVISRAVQFTLTSARGPTFAFFFGLIAASALVLYSEVDVTTVPRLGIAVLGFSLAFWVSGITQGSGLPNSPEFVFVAGMIAITAMILPGISGAFFLLLLGQYDYLTATLTSFTDHVIGLLDGGGVAPLVEPGMTILAFAVGAMIGVVSIAHVIKWALSNYRSATLVFLVSLMAGALRLPAVETLQSTGQWTPIVILGTGAALVVGAGSVLTLDRYTDDLDY